MIEEKHNQKMQNAELFKFVHFYFNCKDEILPSLTTLERELNISIAKLRKFIQEFITCGYLYKQKNKFYIFRSKQNFSPVTDVKQTPEYIEFLAKEWSIKFNKEILYKYEPASKEMQCTDLGCVIYLLFIVSLSVKSNIKTQFVNDENNYLWMIKNCYSTKNNNFSYQCRFTQMKPDLHLYNS